MNIANTRDAEVHEMPDWYKFGWIRGFYSCGFEDIGSDDGDHPRLRFGSGDGPQSEEDLMLLCEGYEAGRAARNDGFAKKLLEEARQWGRWENGAALACAVGASR